MTQEETSLMHFQTILKSCVYQRKKTKYHVPSRTGSMNAETSRKERHKQNNRDGLWEDTVNLGQKGESEHPKKLSAALKKEAFSSL